MWIAHNTEIVCHLHTLDGSTHRSWCGIINDVHMIDKPFGDWDTIDRLLKHPKTPLKGWEVLRLNVWQTERWIRARVFQKLAHVVRGLHEIHLSHAHGEVAIGGLDPGETSLRVLVREDD